LPVPPDSEADRLLKFVVHFERLGPSGDCISVSPSSTIEDLKQRYFDGRGLDDAHFYDVCTFNQDMEKVQLPGTKPLSFLDPNADVLVMVRRAEVPRGPIKLTAVFNDQEFTISPKPGTAVHQLFDMLRRYVGTLGPEYNIYPEDSPEPLSRTDKRPVGDIFQPGDRFTVSREALDYGFAVLERRETATGIEGKVRLPNGEVVRWTEVQYSSDRELQQLQQRMDLMEFCQFPTILKYYGKYTTEATRAFGFYTQDIAQEPISVETTRGWPPEKLHVVLMGVAKALEFLHSREVVHGHLGLPVILLNAKDEPVVELGTGCGGQYLAPELENGTGFGPEVDIFALGIIMYELVVLRNVLSAQHAELIRQGTPPIFPHFPQVVCYQGLVEGCTRVNAAERMKANDVVRFLFDERFADFAMSPTVRKYAEQFDAQIERLDIARDYYEVKTLKGSAILVRRRATGEHFVVKRVLCKSEQELQEYRRIRRREFPSLAKYIGIDESRRQSSVVVVSLLRECVGGELRVEKQTPTQRHVIMYGIAKAIEELHAGAEVHGNLRPSNILLNERCEPVVVGFGLSETARKGMTLDMRLAGGESSLFCAPEVIRDSAFGKEADVFAFGMVAYLVLGGALPPEPDGEVRKRIMSGLKPSFDSKFDELYRELVASCWEFQPGKRPTAKEIVEALKGSPFTQRVNEKVFGRYVNLFGETLPDWWKWPGRSNGI
jgi:serine/threonine protein kinase